MEGDCDLNVSLCESEFKRVGLTFWTGEDGVTPPPLDSHTAASVGDTEYMATLPLVELDSVNCHSWTPLMYSCYLGHRLLSQYLVDRGCDVTNGNKLGRTPLMLAAMCGNVDVVEDLIKVGGKQVIQQADKRNFTALLHAISCGHQDVTEMLLSRGSDPNVTEHNKGYSALMMSAADNNLAIVELLVQHGANISYKTVLGATARSVAESLGHDDVVRCLAKFSKPSALAGPARVELLLEQKRMEKFNKIDKVMDIDVFLSQLGLDKYKQLFVDQEIDFQLLLTMTDSDLKQVGLTLLGPRRKITAAIGRWKEKNGTENKIID